MAAAASPPRPFRAAGTTEAMRVFALGVNLWVIALVLPMLHGGTRGALDAIAAPVPLAPLAAGAIALAWNGRASRRALAITMLLLGFPVSLAIVLASRADLADRDAWGALGLFVTALSLLAYGAMAAEACGRPLALRSSSAQSLSSLVGADSPGRTWLRRGVIAGTTLGGLLVAVIAPALGPRAALIRAWGDAADEATVLASVIGAGASAFALAVLVGPQLRAPRPTEVPRHVGLRITMALLVATSGVVTFLVLRQLEAR